MKLWLLALAVAAVLFPPFKAVDPGRLCVVETLILEQGPGECRVYGGEWSGKGNTVPEAVEDMANVAPGKLFLRQVQRIIYCREATLPVPEEIPAGAAVYRSELDGETLWKDLSDLEPVLQEWEQEKELPRVSDLGREESGGGEGLIWTEKRE